MIITTTAIVTGSPVREYIGVGTNYAVVRQDMMMVAVSGRAVII
ncbi:MULTISPECIES: hypothetical protein [unclassified Paenibacillus]